MLRRISYVLIFLLGINALFWLVTAVRFLFFPYSLDFGEGILLNQSVMLSHGENIYPPITGYPYMVSNYHPLYPFIASIPFLITNPGLWSGRLITLLSAIGCMVLTWKIVARVSERNELGIIAALIPLCLNYPYNWGFVFRVDYLGSFLSLLGLYLFMFPRGKMGIYASLIPFTFAFFTKMTFVIAALACVIDLFVKRSGSRLKFLLALILSLGLPYFILNMATGFEMYRHTIIYTANAFHPARMTEGFREILQYTLPLWLVTALSFSGANGKFKNLFIIYLALHLINLVTYGAEGSDSNYFIELIFVISISSMIYFNRMESDVSKNNGISYIPALAFVLIIAFCFQGRIMTSSEFGDAHNLKALTESQKMVDTIVRNTDGEIISEDVVFLAKNGKKMFFQPYILSLLARTSKWDQSGFVSDIRNGRFNLIILRFDVNDPDHSDRDGDWQEAGFDRFTPEMEQAIKEGYQKPYSPNIKRGKKWFLYIPKNTMNPED